MGDRLDLQKSTFSQDLVKNTLAIADAKNSPDSANGPIAIESQKCNFSTDAVENAEAVGESAKAAKVAILRVANGSYQLRREGSTVVQIAASFAAVMAAAYSTST